MKIPCRRCGEGFIMIDDLQPVRLFGSGVVLNLFEFDATYDCYTCKCGYSISSWRIEILLEKIEQDKDDG